MNPDVAQTGGAQDRIADGVDQRVGVGMPEQPLFPGNADPAENESAFLHQPVKIKTDACSHVNPREDEGLTCLGRK
jgi:hypothetical protein